jgi:hypothetical protein
MKTTPAVYDFSAIHERMREIAMERRAAALLLASRQAELPFRRALCVPCSGTGAVRADDKSVYRRCEACGGQGSYVMPLPSCPL